MSESAEISYGKLCEIFCCPPLPSAWVSKLAFYPPTVKTYELIRTQSNTIPYVLHLSPGWNMPDSRKLIQYDARFVTTSRGNNIVVVFIKSTRNKNCTIIYSHNNANDVGSVFDFCTDLSTKIGCDVVTYDYSGYGQSTGKPSEKNMYADIKSAWDYTLGFIEPDPRKIILFGESIGTVATIELASKVLCAGVIVQSPLMSARKLICPQENRCRFLNYMNSIEKIPKVTSPVLVVHGTKDDLIDMSHGEAIYKSCPRAVEPLWLKGMGHHDITLNEEYVERLLKFIYEDIST